MAEPIKLDGSGTGSTSGSSPKIDTSAGMGNIFTQAQAKKEDSKMISSIISQKDVLQKTKSILGPAPTLEKSIEQEKEAAMKRKLRFYQFIFVMIFAVSAAVGLYFYAELSPDFNLLGANTTARLADTNTNLRQVQTLVNKDRYLAAQLELNEFSYQTDRFLSSVAKINDPSVSEFDKRTLFADLDEAQKSLPILLGDVRNILTQNIVPTTTRSEKEPEQTPEELLQIAQSDLRSALLNEKKKYGANPTNPQDVLDVKLIENASKLVGNTALLNVLQNTSSTAFQKQLEDYSTAPDAQKLKAIQDVVGKVLSTTKSDLATIADIKRTRIEWSSIISQIKDETLNVDKNFDQPLLYDTLGGIVYTGYEFDSNSNKIVLSGMTKTFDGSNFTLISNLIDQLESSVYFQDVDMRSFAKSKTGEIGIEGFAANFKIDLRLETQGFSAKNAPVSLQSNSLNNTVSAGTRRDAAPVATSQQSTSLKQAAPTSSQETNTNVTSPETSTTSSSKPAATGTQQSS